MQKEDSKICKSTLIYSLVEQGYFHNDLPDQLHNLIISYVFEDILRKISFFKNINSKKSSNLEKQVKDSLSKLTNNEIQELFGPISNRYIKGNGAALDISLKLRDYFYSVYGVNFYLHGIRSSDRKTILPNLEESSTQAIWYRIYPPDSICGLPHRDFDFKKIDELADDPIQNSSRVKFWMPICGCNKNNSLRLWPKSHKLNFESEYTSNGRIQPFVSSENLSKCGDFIVPANISKSYVLFDDKTIHHGPKNINKNKDGYRISLETTLFVDSQLLKESIN